MRKFIILLVLFFFNIIIICAQNTDTDFKPIIKSNAEIKAMAIQSDDKLVVSGNFITVDTTFARGLARINPDGRIDETFSFNYKIEGEIFSILCQPDGKIIIMGENINPMLKDVIRLNSDGSIDETFTIIDSNIKSVLKGGIQSSAKYIFFNTYTGKVIRLNTDGSIDDSFTSLGLFDCYSPRDFDLVILPDDKILIAGCFKMFNNSNHGGLVRLNSDGTIDEDFDIGKGLVDISSTINKLGIQSDNKIIVAGLFETFNDVTVKNILRLNTDGSVDSTFLIPGPSANSYSSQLCDVFILNDDRIVMAGSDFQNIWNYKIMMLTPNGNLESSFSIPTLRVALNPDAYYIKNPIIIANSNQQLFIGGNIDKFNDNKISGLASFSLSGEFNDFNAKLGSEPIINTIKIQENGQIVIGGSFIEVNGVTVKNYARLNQDGSLDTVFAKNSGTGPDREILVITLQDDGKILLGGAFDNFNDNPEKAKLIRLNQDGSIDEDFNPHIWGNFVGLGIKQIKLIDNGQIIIAGSFSYINDSYINNFARLNPDGSHDISFNPDNFLSYFDVVNALDFTSDTSIIIAGTTLGAGGFVIRTDSLGVVDNSFNLDFNLNYTDVNSLKVLKNNNIIFGGYFAQVVPDEGKPIYQIDKDGNTIDSISISIKDGWLKKIFEVNDSTVFILGSFKKVNNVDQPGIAKLNLIDGNYTYNIFDQDYLSSINDIDSINNSTIIIGGSYSMIGGNTKSSNVDNTSISKIWLENSLPKIISIYITDSIYEDSFLFIPLDSIIVSDNDYTGDYKISISNGVNYTIKNDTIFPNNNFYGSLLVPISLCDRNNYSPIFNFRLKVIAVNDAPIITGTTSSLTTYKNVPLTINLSDLEVEDIDNSYPNNFSLSIYSGDNYTVDLTSVSPNQEFIGNITVPVSVNDGTINSNNYNVTVEVILSTGIDNSILNQNLSIFPIPFDENLTIEYKNTSEKFIINIIDSESKLVYSKYYQGFKDSNKIYINTSIFKKGLYILELIDGDEIIRRKIIK